MCYVWRTDSFVKGGIYSTVSGLLSPVINSESGSGWRPYMAYLDWWDIYWGFLCCGMLSLLLIDDYICCWSKLWLSLCESLCLSLSHGVGGQWLFVGTSSFSIANLLLAPALSHSSALLCHAGVALCCVSCPLLCLMFSPSSSSVSTPQPPRSPTPPQLLSQWAALSGCHRDAPGSPKRSGGGWNVAKRRWLQEVMHLDGIVSHMVMSPNSKNVGSIEGPLHTSTASWWIMDTYTHNNALKEDCYQGLIYINDYMLSGYHFKSSISYSLSFFLSLLLSLFLTSLDFSLFLRLIRIDSEVWESIILQ